MWRLAHKWLTPPEYTVFCERLRNLKTTDCGYVELKIPFGKTRSFQEVIKSEIRPLI